MKHLGRADAVADVHAKRIHPTFVKLFRQSLAGRVTKAQTRKIFSPGARHVEHRIDHRGNSREDRRLVTLDYFEHLLCSRAFSEQCSRAANCKRKEQISSGGISEEKFRN
jgi:hypothetical protein